MKKNLINEVRQLQKIAGLIREDYQKPSEEHVRKYWETMIEVQPETVLNVLADLTSGRMTIDSFIENTMGDVFDSYRDDLYSNID